jgi:hypothetical protein
MSNIVKKIGKRRVLVLTKYWWEKGESVIECQLCSQVIDRILIDRSIFKDVIDSQVYNTIITSMSQSKKPLSERIDRI